MSDKLKVIGCMEFDGRYQVFRKDEPMSPVFPEWLDARDFVIARKWGHEEKAERPGAVAWLVRDDPEIHIRCGVQIDAPPVDDLADIL